MVCAARAASFGAVWVAVRSLGAAGGRKHKEGSMDFVRGGLARAPLAPPPLPPRDAWTCRALKVARCDFQRWRVAELQLKFVVV